MEASFCIRLLFVGGNSRSFCAKFRKRILTLSRCIDAREPTTMRVSKIFISYFICVCALFSSFQSKVCTDVGQITNLEGHGFKSNIFTMNLTFQSLTTGPRSAELPRTSRSRIGSNRSFFASEKRFCSFLSLPQSKKLIVLIQYF